MDRKISELVRKFMPVSMAEFAGDRDEWIVLIYIPGTHQFFSYTITGPDMKKCERASKWAVHPPEKHWRAMEPGGYFSTLFPEYWSEWAAAVAMHKFLEGLAERGYGVGIGEGMWSDDPRPPQPLWEPISEDEERELEERMSEDEVLDTIDEQPLYPNEGITVRETANLERLGG